jgi:hypothetical protein
MSFSTFADFDKKLKDVFTEDFNTECSFKAKAKAPNNLTFTSTSIWSNPLVNRSMGQKLGVKWEHPSGFTLEKLEVNSKGKVTTETSLVGAAPGLKLDFKGNDTDKADLSFTYKIPSATISAEVDGLMFNRAKVSAFGGAGPISAGFAATFAIAQSDNTKKVYELGATYDGVQNLNVALWANSAKDFRVLSKYKVNDNFSSAIQIEKTSQKTSQSIIGIYGCSNDKITSKLKITRTDGAIGASTSVTQSLDSNFKVTYATGIENFSGFSTSSIKWGVNCTLG